MRSGGDVELDGGVMEKLLQPGGLIADMKRMWKDMETPKTLRRWQL